MSEPEITAAPRTQVRIVDVRPLRGFFTGHQLDIEVELLASGAAEGSLSLRALHPGEATLEANAALRLDAGTTVVTLRLDTGGAGARGRQLEALFTDAVGHTVRATGAVDVLSDWREDPRYGFLCDFAPGTTGVPARIAAMGRYHLNAVQLYDWMYRHHELLPPAQAYRDVLGRDLSLNVVNEVVSALHERSMAALAYATVYAAEKDFSEQHRDWQLTDDLGHPWQLADLFYLMDLSPSSGWTEHMLSQLRAALAAVDFDGFHLDQYGFPRVARGPGGALRDTAGGLEAFVRRANDLLAELRPAGGAIFNHVNGWPLEEIAPIAPIATYIEVWRPHTDYRDLVELTARALRADPATPVILAAYPGFLRKNPAQGLAAGGLALLGAVTLAAGAWPLLIGEGDNILTGGYYPEYLPLEAEPRARLLSVLDAGVAWRDLLRGPQRTRIADAFIDGQDAELGLDLPYSSRPLPGHIWVSMARVPGRLVISLVNLLDADSPRWNHEQPLPGRRRVTVRLPNGIDASRCWVAETGMAWRHVVVASTPRGSAVDVDVEIWTLIVLADDAA